MNLISNIVNMMFYLCLAFILGALAFVSSVPWVKVLAGLAALVYLKTAFTKKEENDG